MSPKSVETYPVPAKSNKSVIYSRLAAQFLAGEVLPAYKFPGPVGCEFYMMGLHDTYLVRDKRRIMRYILRLYRKDWRDLAQISYELELLLYLAKSGLVAAPVQTRDNSPLVPITCPEGERYAALFPFAPGYAPGIDIQPAEAQLLGNSVARMHQASRDFSSQHQRQELSLEYLLDDSVNVVLPFLDSEQAAALKKARDKIYRDMPLIPMQWPYACQCAGDINPTNFHIYKDRITLFDFDQCGFGLRAFEIAKFNASVWHLKDTATIQQSFLKGYQQEATLEADEIQAIPYLVAIAFIWVMAIQVYNIDIWGSQRLGATYWQSRIQLVGAILS